jgi:threonine/homoserine/homoserine lactone efflux protein
MATLASLVQSRAFATYLIAVLVLALVPGPGVVYIVTRTLSAGRRAGLASVLGVALGNLANATAASVGLAAVLAASSAVFYGIKIAGAMYLVFLGIGALRARPIPAPTMSRELALPVRVLRDGFVVALLNPKTALFFAALLPQFIDPQASVLGQSIALGVVFVLLALCTDTVYVLAAGALGAALGRWAGDRPYGQYLTAGSLLALGLYAALSNPRAAR